MRVLSAFQNDRSAVSSATRSLSPHVAVALVCCVLGAQGCDRGSAQTNIAPVYDPDTGHLKQLRYDSDRNGTVDTVSYMDGARVLRIEIDKDEDGKVERWEYYDAARKLETVGLSRANDGVEDAWSYMGPDGKVARVAISTRRDGRISRTEFYQADLPTSAEEDADGDGVVDKWESYDSGRLVCVAFDSMHRGRPDRRLTYSPDVSVKVEAVETPIRLKKGTTIAGPCSPVGNVE